MYRMKVKMEINEEYINKRIKQLIKNRKDIPKECLEKRREVAIRQTQGRILELRRLKNESKRNR